MSLSSSSTTDEFSSAGGESTGRVVREEVPPESKSSSATPSCMNDSSGAPAVDIPQEFEFIVPQKNLRPGYQWVNPKVREYFSKYRSANELRSFLSRSQIYYSDIENDIISFRRVGDVDNLHPNGWAAWATMQAFSILCKLLSLSPSPSAFLYYYSSRPGKRPGWLSLISKSNVCFLKPFTSSYKDFKGSFFKILIEPIGREYFFNGNSPKFPLYWTKDPVKFNSISFHSMGVADRHVIEVFSRFSYQVPTRALLQLYTSSHPREDLTALMASTNPKARSYFSKLLNKVGDVTPRRENVVNPVVEVETVEPVANVDVVEPTSNVDVAGPSKKSKKRDRSSKRSHSSSRRHRHSENVSSEPLPETIFSATTKYAKFVQTSFSESSYNMLKNMDAASLADSVIELSSRNLLIGKMMKEKNGNCVSLSEFEKLKNDLAEYKERMNSLSLELEKMKKQKKEQEIENEGVGKEISDLKNENLKSSAKNAQLFKENQLLRMNPTRTPSNLWMRRLIS
ncbi:uncharacterized protein [Phaseolus vulgaris]|uniref:uncharacterized protein n=1 Tax=Phaseolus vulgaris TaxID=3885 RepID=UPI0035CBCCB8